MRKGLLQKHAELLSLMFRLTDLAIILFGGLVAYWLKFGNLVLTPPYQILLALVVVLGMVSFPAFGLYQPWRGAGLWEESKKVLIAWGAVMAACAVLSYLTKTGALYSRLMFGTWVLIVACSLIAARLILRLALNRLREQGFNKRKVAIIGAGRLGREVVRMLRAASWTGLEVSAFFDDDATLQGTIVDDVPVVGTLDDITKTININFLHDNGQQCNSNLGICVDQIWIALPLSASGRLKTLLGKLDQLSVTIHYVPDFFGFNLLNQSVEQVAGIPIVNLSSTSIAGTDRLLKEIEDRVLATIFLILASPLLVSIAIGVKLSSPGPVLYRQTRVTWGGQPFEMLKFRSMPVDAEQKTGPVWARPGESRATRFGALLRKTSLDELPQFINVLKGEMSIVGPRPERPHFIEEFKEEVPMYMRKHLVKGGITGWAQVNGWRGQTSIKRRIEHDIYYIENWSIGFDLKIMLLTVTRGLVSSNAY